MTTLKSYCKVCGNSCQPLFDEQFHNMYEKCTLCGFIHLQSAYHVTFSEERAEYDLHDNSIEDQGYVKYLERFLAAAVTPFIKEGSALEFGCGPGPVLAELLKRKGFDVSTYDKHFNPDTSVLDLRYDLVTATEVFEHFNNPREDVAGVFSLLGQGGILAVMTSVPPRDDAAFLKWHYRREKTHISFYTRRAFEILAEENGAELIFHDDKRISVFRKN